MVISVLLGSTIGKVLSLSVIISKETPVIKYLHVRSSKLVKGRMLAVFQSS